MKNDDSDIDEDYTVTKWDEIYMLFEAAVYHANV